VLTADVRIRAADAFRFGTTAGQEIIVNNFAKATRKVLLEFVLPS